jgi:hypothetical protein
MSCVAREGSEPRPAMNAQRRKRRERRLKMAFVIANFLRLEVCAAAALNEVRALVGGIYEYCSASNARRKTMTKCVRAAANGT